MRFLRIILFINIWIGFNVLIQTYWPGADQVAGYGSIIVAWLSIYGCHDDVANKAE